MLSTKEFHTLHFDDSFPVAFQIWSSRLNRDSVSFTFLQCFRNSGIDDAKNFQITKYDIIKHISFSNIYIISLRE